MLSRRAFVLSAAATSTAAAALARSQAVPQARGETAPTVLRLERRSIEVNGKSASVFGIRQPDGSFGIRTRVGPLPAVMPVKFGISDAVVLYPYAHPVS